MDIGLYVGLDVHKDSIAVGQARPGREEPVSIGVIAHDGVSVRRLMNRLSSDGTTLSFCYEAGPCGYGLYRQIVASGHDCIVVAPSLVPRRPGDRVKTDCRDAVTLARLHRSGDLTACWVPGPGEEAIRDLIRAREDMKEIERRARQRLGAFLLRHSRVYAGGRARWTQAHFRWLEAQKFEDRIQQIVLQEYVDAVSSAQERVAQLATQIREAVDGWSLRPAVEALRALRGVDVLTAATVLAELGDLSRFDNPRQLMAFLGLVPSEHSSGSRRRQGSITKTGNAHVRRVLIESAWCYRFPARKTAHLRKKGADASPEVQAVAWKAQKRLCGRYQRLSAAGKPTCKVTTAVARELVGFMWAIVRMVGEKGNSGPIRRATT